MNFRMNLKNRFFPAFLLLVPWLFLVQAESVFAYSPGDEPPAQEKTLSAPGFNQGNGAESLDLVQSSEVNIQLEKKMPPLKPEPHGSDSGTFEDFEDLEDPFADETPEIPELRDPMENYNRFMHRVNDRIYDYFMEPVARGYRKVVHERIRLSLRNAFNNAMSPVKLFSSVVQGDVDKTARVLSRLVLNTTVGLGGLFDVAGKYYDVPDVHEDFGQALGFHGVPSGPYVVLPFLGPSTARDVTGQIVDSFLSPTIFLAPGFLGGAALNLSEQVNDTSFILDDQKALEESAIDEYESVRDFYHQSREKQIRE